MNKIEHPKSARFHGFLLKLDLALLTISLLPIFLIAEKFIKPKKRGNLWRKAGTWLVQTVFYLNNIELKAKKAENIFTDEPTIYTANHPSEMDGFMLLALLGPNTVLFTAPFEHFPGILKAWLTKMEAIDVRRDLIDDKKYPLGHSKKEAIEFASKHLKAGRNLIIFPEGHIEMTHILHYFHTGPARISLVSQTPIIPISIINADKCFPDSSHVYAGKVDFVFSKKINPPTSKSIVTVKKVTDKIEKEIVANLPLRVLPEYYYKKKDSTIGVFVDIDRTIYEGLSQKDLIAYLLYLHKIEAKEAFRIFYWLMLEKMNLLEHKQLMKKALLVLKGWDVAEFDYQVGKIFHDKLIKKFQYGLFPILVDHIKSGHSLILVSEAIHPLAKEFKHFLGAKVSLDTKLKAEHHCYTGKTHCLCYKEKKAELIKKFCQHSKIDLHKSYAFADSFSDVPFLSLIKHPTAVNPDDKLLDFAVDHNWEVMLDAS